MMRGQVAPAVDREGVLRELIVSSPSDPFPRYGLAMELKGSGRLDEAAKVFEELVSKFPDYIAAYLHAGNTLAGLGRRREAIAVYRAGIEACTRKRDDHAKGEIQTALADLELTTEETR